MKALQKQEIVIELLNLLQPRLQLLDVDVRDVETATSLFDQGIIDSIFFLEYLVEIETKFGVSFDFMSIEPSEVSSIKLLADYILNINDRGQETE